MTSAWRHALSCQNESIPIVQNWIKQVVGPSKVPGGNKPQTYFLLGSWAFFAFIGLLIPQDVLTKNEWAREFTDFMAAIVPQIDRITALGLKPEINRFHYSVLWAVAPVYFVVIMISGNKNFVLGYGRMNMGQIVAGLLFSVIVIWFSMWGIGSMESNNRVTRVLFYYSLSRAVNAPIFAFAPWMFSGVIVLIIKSMITGDIHKKINEDDSYGRH